MMLSKQTRSIIKNKMRLVFVCFVVYLSVSRVILYEVVTFEQKNFQMCWWI